MSLVSEVNVTSPSYTVLMVENVGNTQNLYRHFLMADTSCHYTIVGANTVAEAVGFCRRHSVDGILVDDVLPDLTGLEFVQELQLQLKGDAPPFVIVTAESDPAIAVRAIKLGVEDYLIKQTLTSKQLQSAMRSAIENTRLRLQLQHQEERFRISVENLLDCFGCCSAIRNELGQIVDFRIDYLNRVACDSNRMTEEEQIGRGLCELLPAHRETGLFDEYCRVVETGEPLFKESLIYDDNFAGQRLIRAFDIHATKLDDGFVVCWRDVTERKRLELTLSQHVADLQQQQYRLQRLIDTAPIGIGVAAATGEVSIINDEMLRLHGYTREEFERQGMNWRDFAPPELTPRADQVMELLRQGGTLPSEEKELVRRDGSRIPIGISLMQWQDGTDEHVAFAVDLTRQKQAETAIQRLNQELSDRKGRETQLPAQQEQLRLFTKHAPAGIAMFDQEMRYLLASDRWLSSYGLEGQEIIGRSHYEIFPEIPDDWREIHQRCLAGAVEAREEDPFPRADGSLDWVRWEIRPWHTETGHIGGIIIFSEVITERKQAEQHLRESQEQLRLGVQVAGIALARVDYAANTVTLSPEAASLYGIPANELTISRDRLHATFHPDDRGRLAHLIQQVLDPSELGWFSDEHRVVWQNGEVRWLSVRKQIFFDCSGETPRPDYAILAAIDMTERKHIDVALRQSHESLANTLESITDAFIALDDQWRFTFVNPQAARFLRRTQDQLMGKNVWEEFPEGVGTAFDRAYRRAIAEQVTVQVEEFYPPLDAWIELRIYPTRSGLAVYFQDVTARRAAAVERERLLAQEQTARTQVEALVRQLAIEQSRLEQILQQMPVGVVIVEAPSGKIVFFNDEAVRIFRHPLRESDTVEGYTQYGGIHPDGSPFQSEDYPVARSLLFGEVVRGEEIRYRRGDGTETIVSINAAPILSDDGQPVAVVGTFEDVALRKQIEAERDRLLLDAEAARSEAEAANRSKDDFISLVAHELRSPLNAILGWAKLLQTRPFDQATRNKALDTIARNAQAQAQLVEDLLDISRMVRGALRLTMAPINLDAVVESAVETVHLTAESKGLQLVTQLYHTPSVTGDFQRLQQVMLNLLTNAIKFTPEGGQVRILLDQQGVQVRIQVSDTGKGMSPELLPHIFERFQQDQQNTTTKQGLGLGLTIVKYIVEQHGGIIAAESPGEGQGATFTVLLPLPEQSEIAPEDAVSESSVPVEEPLPLTNVRVLLVDDDSDILGFLVLMLEHSGAIVRAANNVRTALALLPQFQPDVLVVDLAMPEENGYDLVRQLRTMQDFSQTPAIALTAYSIQSLQEESFQAGFQQHLTKPIEQDRLVRAILAAIQWRQVAVASTSISDPAVSVPANRLLTGTHVLVVDDEPDTLDFIALALETSGAIVQTANSVNAALERLPQFQPDVLVIDLAMPGGNGYDLLRQLRQIPQHSTIPAIALTAYTSDTRRNESFQAGFQQHLTKPVEPGELITVIFGLVRGMMQNQ